MIKLLKLLANKTLTQELEETTNALAVAHQENELLNLVIQRYLLLEQARVGKLIEPASKYNENTVRSVLSSRERRESD